jgi:hypothetical protein
MIRLKNLIKEDIIEKSSPVPIITEALPVIEKLGNKTLLTRTFKGITSGAAKITSGPITKGRIGTVLHPDSPIHDSETSKIFQQLIDRFNLQHIIYCSHGDRQFFSGNPYIMIPIGKYKTIWSPDVRDIYADIQTLKDKGNLKAFPIDTYTDTWPKGNVDEVLVDCEEYYMISLRIPIIQNYMRKQNLGTYKGRTFVPDYKHVKTYDQLYDILQESIKPYVKS